MIRARRFILALLGLCLVGAPGWILYAYCQRNRLALDTAMAICRTRGSVEVLNGPLWLELSRYSQADRLRNPAHGLAVRDFSTRAHHSVSGVAIVEAVAYSGTTPVLKLHDTVVHERTILSEVGLETKLASYSCLDSAPSKFREVLVGR